MSSVTCLSNLDILSLPHVDFNCVPFLLYSWGLKQAPLPLMQLFNSCYRSISGLHTTKFYFPGYLEESLLLAHPCGLDSHRLRSGTMPSSRHTALASLAYLSTSAVPCLMTPSGYYVPSDSQSQLPAAQPVPDSELLSWLHDAIPPTMHEHLVPVVWNRNPQSRISLIMMAAVLRFV